MALTHRIDLDNLTSLFKTKKNINNINEALFIFFQVIVMVVCSTVWTQLPSRTAVISPFFPHCHVFSLTCSCFPPSCHAFSCLTGSTFVSHALYQSRVNKAVALESVQHFCYIVLISLLYVFLMV